MIYLTPEQIAQLWEVDGSLRDVYAEGMTTDRWRSFLALAKLSDCRYTADGEPATAPDVPALFDDRTHSHLLTLTVEGVQINCHFFSEDDLELDIDPREVQDASAHAEVLRFLERLADIIQLPVSVTPENTKASPYLSYELGAARWTWHEVDDQGNATPSKVS